MSSAPGSIAAAIVVAAVGSAVFAAGPRPEKNPVAASAGREAREGLGEAAPEAPAYKQRGMALGMFAEDVSFSYATLLHEIAALGVTHVALIVPVYQTDGRSADLALHTRFSPTLGLVADTVRAARRERLEVTLFPIVRLSRPAPGEWRGTLAPARRADWFRHYGEILADLAALGAQTGASRLVIGSELSTLDGAGDLERWRRLLEPVRAIFSGRLLYSANWDHYRDARLYELVDEDGVAAYFSLREDPRMPVTDAALDAAWQRRKDELAAWRTGRTHPLLFTELGYRSRAGSTASPWDETPGGFPDPTEQQRGFASFHRVWSGSPLLNGVYVWNWYGYGGPESLGYTPRGKPALSDVKRIIEDL